MTNLETIAKLLPQLTTEELNAIRSIAYDLIYMRDKKVKDYLQKLNQDLPR